MSAQAPAGPPMVRFGRLQSKGVLLGLSGLRLAAPMAARRRPERPSSTPLDCSRPNRTIGGPAGACALIAILRGRSCGQLDLSGRSVLTGGDVSRVAALSTVPVVTRGA